MYCYVGVPTSPPCREEGLGDELGSELKTSVPEYVSGKLSLVNRVACQVQLFLLSF
jgi:hypothetical protein